MQLARSTDIALRLLMLVGTALPETARSGGERGEERVTVARLAVTLDVPPHHLAKIVQRLQHHGLVETTRGRGGGVRLAPSAPAVPVGHIIRALEGDGEVAACEEPPCPLSRACRLRGELRRAQEAFLATLDETRLADLLQPPTAAALVQLRVAT